MTFVRVLSLTRSGEFRQRDTVAVETPAADSLLEQAIAATKPTERDRATELFEALAEESLSGVVTWSKNLTVTFREAIEGIDRMVSKQLAAVMHT